MMWITKLLCLAQAQLTALCKDERGATAIEYGLIAALVAVGIIAALSTLGDELTSIFDQVSSELASAS